MKFSQVYLFALLLSQISACKGDFDRGFSGRKAQSTASDADAAAADAKYSEAEVKDILETINQKDPDSAINYEDIFENGLTPQEIEQIMDYAAKKGDLTPEQLDQLHDSLLDIAAKAADSNDDVYDNGAKKSDNPIAVIFEPGKIHVTSPAKDLSNVVIEFADGSRQRFEGLTGHTGDFAGTGENAGKVIVKTWIKAGSNHSGDGPGYGELFEAAK